MLLSAQDVESLAAAVEPGSIAAALIWGEHVGGAVRRGRAPGGWPAGRERAGGPGVIGPAPVARTAAVVGTAAVVAHGVDRRHDRRDDRDDRRDRR